MVWIGGEALTRAQGPWPAFGCGEAGSRNNRTSRGIWLLPGPLLRKDSGGQTTLQRAAVPQRRARSGGAHTFCRTERVHTKVGFLRFNGGGRFRALEKASN